MAPNPLFVGGHFHKKLQATVIMDIWPEVLFFSLVAASEPFLSYSRRSLTDYTVVASVSELTTHSLAISNQLLTVLGTVLGLVISFRTSTAYERCAFVRRVSQTKHESAYIVVLGSRRVGGCGLAFTLHHGPLHK